MSEATFIVGDTRKVLAAMPEASVDLILSSPPFLALRSYLPADHPDKALEIGSESTPAEFLDVLLEVTALCRRVLAPHGTLAFELGDTYSGSGGAGGDYAAGGLRDGQGKFDGSAARGRPLVDRPARSGRLATYPDGRGNPDGMRDTTFSGANTRTGGGNGWPLAKSLCMIPEAYRMSLAYGRNILTGEPSPAGQWRVRNVVRWCRPNPPVGALGDKFRPATSEMVIACTSGKRWFDLDAVRSPFARDDGGETWGSGAPPKNTKVGLEQRVNTHNGAPPLDWWEIPTEPNDETGTVRRFRVPVDAHGDGIRRTTSPGCPVHGSLDLPGSSAPGDARAGSASNRNGHTDGRLDRAPGDGSPPTSATPEPLGATMELPGLACVPAATSRSTSDRRTDLAPGTTSPGKPSAQTLESTDDTSSALALSEPHPDTLASSNAEACPPAVALETAPSIDRKPDPSPACTCSFYVDVEIPWTQDSTDYATWPTDAWRIPTEGFPGSHYATWPTELLRIPILAMCPARVCRTCGEPSRRIVGDAEYVGAHTTVIRQAPSRWTDCGHDDWRRGHVLDPFGGSGTTAVVATGNGRDCTLIDIDARNVDLARERVGMMLAEVTTCPPQ